MTTISVPMAATPTLLTRGPVVVLCLGAGENRLNAESVASIEACLDEVEAGDSQALVITGDGKFFSNGLDQQWMAANPDLAAGSVRAMEALFGRVLAFPMPTVAAIQGHAYAGGLMLALCHDVRLMRADRGFVCLPEVMLGVQFTAGMQALLTSSLSPRTARVAMTLGQRYAGPAARDAGMVDEVVDSETLLERAVGVAEALGGNRREHVAALKQDLHARALSLLGAVDPPEALVRGLTRPSA